METLALSPIEQPSWNRERTSDELRGYVMSRLVTLDEIDLDNFEDN